MVKRSRSRKRAPSKKRSKKRSKSRRKSKGGMKLHKYGKQRGRSLKGGASCPSGEIQRVGYTRSDGVYVEPTCVKDMGKPGKTPASEKVLPPIEADEFFGRWGFDLYDKEKRENAIRDAVKGLEGKAYDDLGYAHLNKDAAVNKVIRHIVLPMNYTKNEPKQHRAWQDALSYAQSLK